jgi:hypothetical protein
MATEPLSAIIRPAITAKEGAEGTGRAEEEQRKNEEQGEARESCEFT